jgi:lipid-binding SYLF domain-containing protein
MKSIARLLVLGLFALPAFADHDAGDARKLLDKSDAVLQASLSAPDKGIPKDALDKAECVGVFPDVKKAAFIVGGQGGHGVFTCRDSSGTFGAPAYFKIAGGSVGWQFGGQETDLVLLVMNDDGMKHLLEDKFTIGAEATATAGPVGRTAKAATDAQLQAGILSWSRSQGAFVGAALDGSVVKPDKDMNRAVYGSDVTARAILMDRSVQPKDATAYLKSLNSVPRTETNR